MESTLVLQKKPGSFSGSSKRRVKHSGHSRPLCRLALVNVLAILFLFGSGAVSHAQDADELYRTGRFEEAQERYAALDMDHPKSLHYRYNRGCAAFQAGDLEAAAAAFQSVLRRTEDPSLRARAAYNLGNVALKNGDFASAAGYYRDVLRLDPDHEDAPHNLELALRSLRKQKESGNPEDERPQGGTEGQNPSQGEGNSDQGPPDESTDKPTETKGSNSKEDPGEAPGSAEDGPADKAGESPPQQAPPEETRQSEDPDRKPHDAGEAQPAENRQPTPEGDLCLREDLQEPPTPRDTAPRSAAAMDREKARALLDNVRENPGRALRFQIPSRRGSGAASGKDW
ncbi:tetratricopeptide repeat protein [Desulfatiglans anilini]|uniref:tetratricopeptide repeat protein n=1 Tax=Desulfatiglans anilini TaxID=90728 RepID=UPI000409873F|nr:tetratricopeptide repeat protein [Desulfatiglans anilini]